MELFWIKEKKQQLGKNPKRFDVLHIDNDRETYLISDIRTGEFSIINGFPELANNYVREKKRSVI